ncbi:TPA: glutamate synthase subunit alpha [Staphylococcus aureus]|nr:glutamate synthase subunit alpha [Staphylococcus aureus]
MHNEKLIKGLYDYREEHDACGIGFYANMDNKRSHDIIDKSLEMLRRLDHRGGVGADGITGDGAGIMTEIPFAFFKQHVTDFDIPGEGEYAVGLFFSKERILGSEHEVVFKKYFEGEGLSILGYRNVPVNKDAIAKHVADTMPVIQQVFIDIRDIEDVEKRLFLARKQLEFYSTQCDLELYFTSLSRKTIVYKGWLRSDQIKKLYTDLSDDLYQSKLGLVHSRFSTNTFPSWKRAHPNRMLMHNGEINTIKGNVNWMRARQHKLIETLFGEDQHKVFQIVDEDGSDSAIVDNALEFLSLAMEPEKAAMLLIPEPWLYNEANDANVRAFYEFYSYLMEPWDGPTMISFCNGDKLGALTDRNGLRPGRYTITKDNFIVFSSEVGVVDVPESNVAFKGQLNPGKLLLVDFKQNKVIENNDLKGAIAGELPYKAWIDNHKVDFDFENIQYQDSQWKDETLFKLQRQFAYTKEEIHKYIQELVEGKKDPIGAMGYDAPIAVLNERPESLFNYFKQLFAQVTNPPIDAYREKIVTSELSYLGGEDAKRYEVQVDGSNKVSAIKQVASGRFGVTSDYLQHAKEIQIKVAQGAKPGEGGQLPGTKVYPWIAKTRGSTPGIGLISPPPHHDIYSIEDLAQLIHDLKNANKDADIAVKLVSKTGVGTIASGVAKAFADKIVISGYDGGTGASPKTSIQHAGVPWEIGLAETHQTLKLNDLRSRVKLETDGKLLTGKDVAYACALGAEEFGFATAPLVVLGCIMMRVCHKDTCPVGVATQNKDLRALYRGKAHHVVNFMHFIAQELREILASLGLKRVEDLVGRTDLLQRSSTLKANSKAASIDVEKLLCPFDGPNTKEIQQNHNLEHGFDLTNLYEVTKPYIAEGRRYTGSFTVNNEQRDVGVITGSEISKQYGEAGLPENTINVYTNGHAGQSLAAYAPKGLMIHHTGDANDYVGKGLSGGTVIVKAPFEERQNEIIAGNVSFYGATGGKAFINGSAGERFCIRNSGVDVVVEGIGDHGLEYMTGGHVINLGDVGKNFGQGMSGGIAYVIPSDVEAFVENNQLDTLSFTKIKHQEEKAFIKQMLEEHVSHTNSTRAIHVLKHFDRIEDVVVKVIPKDYQLMMQKIHLHKSLHDNEDEAMLAAFYDDSKTIDAKHKPAVVY